MTGRPWVTHGLPMKCTTHNIQPWHHWCWNLREGYLPSWRHHFPGASQDWHQPKVQQDHVFSCLCPHRWWSKLCHVLLDIIEYVSEHPTYMLKSMIGLESCMLDPRCLQSPHMVDELCEWEGWRYSWIIEQACYITVGKFTQCGLSCHQDTE